MTITFCVPLGVTTWMVTSWICPFPAVFGGVVVVLMVYAAVATELMLSPLACATALMVSVFATLIAAVYLVDAVVGVLPSVV